LDDGRQESARQGTPVTDRVGRRTAADLKLMGKSEIEIGYWTGDSFRLMAGGSRPLVTHWARLGDFLPEGVELVHQRIFDADVRE
jgi:hypothetical protein